jgi:hypothetical protein
MCATLIACGGDEEPKAMGKPMQNVMAEQEQADAEPNRPPAIELITLNPQRPRPGDTIRAEIRASDPDGDPVRFSYHWQVNGERAGESADLRLKNLSRGTLIELRVVPNDGQLEGPAKTVSVNTGNQPPVLLGVVLEPLGMVTVNHDVVAAPRARDPEGDDLRYRYSWTVNGMPVGGDDEVLPASKFNRGDEITLRVVAFDGTDESEPLQSDVFVVANAPPVITSAPGAFTGDGTYRYQVAAEDPDGDQRMRYRLLESPPGMSVDVLFGMVTWSPADSQAGAHPVVIEVDDMEGGKTTQSFELRVSASHSVPANQQ